MTLSTLNFSDHSIVIGRPAPAFYFSKGRVTHDFELSSLISNREKVMQYSFFSNAGYAIRKTTAVGVRYQYSWRILKKDFRLTPYVGLSVENSFTHNAVDPYESALYKTSFNLNSLYFDLIPGLRYNLSKRVALDLSLPVGFANMYYMWDRVEIPTWSLAEQRSSEFGFDMKPGMRFMLRAGIAVKL